jgi:hypothetical protein
VFDLALPAHCSAWVRTHDLLAELSSHPRSYPGLHLGPLLPRHPQLAGSLLPTSRAATGVWLEIYRRLAHGLNLVMCPEWTFERTSADAIITFLLGAVDRDPTGTSARAALDGLARHSSLRP